MLYNDLKKNHGIEINMTGFIHDAIEFDFHVKDMFTILDRVDYWFKQYHFEKWNIPSDYDYAIGLSKYSVKEPHYSRTEKGLITFNTGVVDFYGTDKDKLDKMIHKYYRVLDSDIKEVDSEHKQPYKFEVFGFKPNNRFQQSDVKAYDMNYILMEK